jgi:hypothetical protein
MLMMGEICFKRNRASKDIEGTANCSKIFVAVLL